MSYSIILPTLEDGPALPSCGTIALFHDKRVSIEQRVLKAIKANLPLAPELIEYERRLYLSLGPRESDRKYHLDPNFFDRCMIPVPGHPDWECNPLYPREWPRRINKNLVKSRLRPPISREKKLQQRRCKRKKFYKKFFKKRAGKKHRGLVRKATKCRKDLKNVATVQLPLSKPVKFEDEARDPPEVKRQKQEARVEERRKKGPVCFTIKLDKGVKKDFSRRNQVCMFYQWRLWKAEREKVKEIYKDWDLQWSFFDPLVLRRSSEREVKTVLFVMEQHEKRRRDKGVPEKFPDEVDQYEVENWSPQKLKDVLFPLHPKNVESEYDPHTFSTEAGVNLKPIVLDLFNNYLSLEDCRQVKECIDDMINLTVCQELIPQLATVETISDYIGTEKHRLKLLHPKREFEKMNELLHVLQHHESVHSQSITSPMFAIVETEKAWWTFPLRPFLEIIKRRTRKINLKKFRRFTPTNVQPIDVFKVFLTTNMNKKGEATLPTDYYEFHSVNEIVFLYMEEFKRLRRDLGFPFALDDYYSIVTETFLDNPVVTMVETNENPRQYFHRMVFNHIKHLGGKFQWRKKPLNLEDLPLDNKKYLAQYSDRRRINRAIEQKEEEDKVKRAEKKKDKTIADILKFAVKSNKNEKKILCIERKSQPIDQPSHVKYVMHRLKELDKQAFSFESERTEAKKRLIDSVDSNKFKRLEESKNYVPKTIPTIGFLESQHRRKTDQNLEHVVKFWMRHAKQKAKFPLKYEEDKRRVFTMDDEGASSSGIGTENVRLLKTWKHEDFKNIKKINIYGSKEFPISSPTREDQIVPRRLLIDAIRSRKFQVWTKMLEDIEEGKAVMKPWYEMFSDDKEEYRKAQRKVDEAIEEEERAKMEKRRKLQREAEEREREAKEREYEENAPLREAERLRKESWAKQLREAEIRRQREMEEQEERQKKKMKMTEDYYKDQAKKKALEKASHEKKRQEKEAQEKAAHEQELRLKKEIEENLRNEEDARVEAVQEKKRQEKEARKEKRLEKEAQKNKNREEKARLKERQKREDDKREEHQRREESCVMREASYPDFDFYGDEPETFTEPRRQNRVILVNKKRTVQEDDDFLLGPSEEVDLVNRLSYNEGILDDPFDEFPQEISSKSKGRGSSSKKDEEDLVILSSGKRHATGSYSPNRGNLSGEERVVVQNRTAEEEEEAQFARAMAAALALEDAVLDYSNESETSSNSSRRNERVEKSVEMTHQVAETLSTNSKYHEEQEDVAQIEEVKRYSRNPKYYVGSEEPEEFDAIEKVETDPIGSECDDTIREVDEVTQFEQTPSYPIRSEQNSREPEGKSQREEIQSVLSSSRGFVEYGKPENISHLEEANQKSARKKKRQNILKPETQKEERRKRIKEQMKLDEEIRNVFGEFDDTFDETVNFSENEDGDGDLTILKMRKPKPKTRTPTPEIHKNIIQVDLTVEGAEDNFAAAPIEKVIKIEEPDPVEEQSDLPLVTREEAGNTNYIDSVPEFVSQTNSVPQEVEIEKYLEEPQRDFTPLPEEVLLSSSRKATESSEEIISEASQEPKQTVEETGSSSIVFTKTAERRLSTDSEKPKLKRKLATKELDNEPEPRNIKSKIGTKTAVPTAEPAPKKTRAEQIIAENVGEPHSSSPMIAERPEESVSVEDTEKQKEEGNSKKGVESKRVCMFSSNYRVSDKPIVVIDEEEEEVPQEQVQEQDEEQKKEKSVDQELVVNDDLLLNDSPNFNLDVNIPVSNNDEVVLISPTTSDDLLGLTAEALLDEQIVNNEQQPEYQYTEDDLLGEYGQLEEIDNSPVHVIKPTVVETEVVEPRIVEQEPLEPDVVAPEEIAPAVEEEIQKEVKKRGRPKKKIPPAATKTQLEVVSEVAPVAETDNVKPPPRKRGAPKKTKPIPVNEKPEAAPVAASRVAPGASPEKDTNVAQPLSNKEGSKLKTNPTSVKEELVETPEHSQPPRKRTRQSDSIVSIPTERAARSKRLFLSKNNPAPRIRKLSPIASTPSVEPVRRTGVATQRDGSSPGGTPEKLKHLPKSIRQMIEVDSNDTEETAPPVEEAVGSGQVEGSAEQQANGEGEVKTEPLDDEHWIAPPPLKDHYRKSKKRLREEKTQKILDEIKTEVYGDQTVDHECQIVMTKVVVKEEDNPEMDDCRIFKAHYNVDKQPTALEDEVGVAKPIDPNGDENPTHRHLITKKLYAGVNELFMTDPDKFSQLMLILAKDTEKKGRVFKFSVSVDNRASAFSQKFVEFLAESPKALSEDLEILMDYSRFSSTLREKASLLISNHRITPFFLHQIIEKISEIKKNIRESCDLGIIGDGERDCLNATEKILLGRYIESVVKITGLSQVTWTTGPHVKRRLEMIYHGWKMFLCNGGFFRILLAMNREDVKPISETFRNYCKEYLAEIEINYGKAIEVYMSSEDDILENALKKSNISAEDLIKLDEDIQSKTSSSHTHKCSQCFINNQPVFFSSSSLLQIHEKLHEIEMQECGRCYDDYTEIELILHRINSHYSLRLQDDE